MTDMPASPGSCGFCGAHDAPDAPGATGAHDAHGATGAHDATDATGATPSTDFASQFRRVYEAAQCRTQTELGKFLGIRQSSVADAKRRKGIPAEWLVTLYTKRRINPDWIRDGVSPPYLMPAEHAPTLPQDPDATWARLLPETLSTRELLDELGRRALRPSSSE